jgi:NPCBM/NEW2 domain
MILGLEIALLIAGLAALIKGEFKLNRNTVVSGPAARIAGAIWLLPLPVALLVGVLVGSQANVRPVERTPFTALVFLEGGIVLVALVLGLLVALVGGSPSLGERPQHRRPPRRGENRGDSIPVLEQVDPEARGVSNGNTRRGEPVQVGTPSASGPRRTRPQPVRPARTRPTEHDDLSPASPLYRWLIAGVAALVLVSFIGGGLWAFLSNTSSEPLPTGNAKDARFAIIPDRLLPGAEKGEIRQPRQEIPTPPPMPAPPPIPPKPFEGFPPGHEPFRPAPPPAPLGREDAGSEDERPDTPSSVPFAVDPKLKDATGKVYLSDLQEFATTAGPMGWSFGKNGNLGNSYKPGAIVQVQGKPYPRGLSMHPPWRGYKRVCYALGKRAKSCSGAVGINDEGNVSGSPPTRFVLLGDGRVLWRSPILQARNVTHSFNIDVSQVEILELRTFTVNESVTYAHAVWLDPYLIAK